MVRLKVLQRRKVIFVLYYNRRMTGKQISFSDILKSFDSSMQALFDLYLSIQDSTANVLKGKKEYAVELLERAVNAGEVTFLDLDHWVIFEYFAKEPSFERIREQLESKVKIV